MSAPTVSASNILRKRNHGVRDWIEKGIKLICGACAALSIFVTFGIVAALLLDSFHFFKVVSVKEFFGSANWAPDFAPPHFGVLSLVWGTFVIALGSGLIAVPLGLLVGVYLSEYARPKVRMVLKPTLELLAGIPTVVYGFFGIFVVTPLLRKLIPGVDIFNGLSGCIVVGIMVLPLVASLCEDAIRAVPRGLREAAYGLGSTKFEVTMKIVIPGALSGIVAGFILALSRAVGETMAVTLAAGSRPSLTIDLRQQLETMTAYIVGATKGDTHAGSPAYYALFAVGLTLFVITFAMNIVANKLVRKYRQVYS